MDPLSRRRFLKLGTRVGGAAALGPWAASLSGALPPPDLLISGGTVIDPMNGVQGIRDVLIRGDVIQSVGRFTVADIRDARGEPLVIDAKGKWVVPGLVDLHAHVDGPGAKLGLQVDDLMSETGVTTCVSAGDVGHGGGSFDFNVAEAARDQGLRPDTLSSDLHSASIVSPGKARLPWVMSKFMQMGYSLEEVVAMATVRPATVINRVPNLGTLSLGAPADVTVLEMVNKPSVFIDTMENERTGDRHLRPVAVVRAGRWMA